MLDGVEVRIADSGPGISPELREQIFNPFVTTKKTGVGLGLSIVSKIIDGHHGINSRRESFGWEWNVANAGACFVMFFPAVARRNCGIEQCSSGDFVSDRGRSRTDSCRRF